MGHIDNRISIQVSLSGYSFCVGDGAAAQPSLWQPAQCVFTSPELQRRYDVVEISLLTPKVALVPVQFFSHETKRQALADVATIEDGDLVEDIAVSEYGAVLLYSNSIGETLSRTIAQNVRTVAGDTATVLPEMYYILRSLQDCTEYNRIVASYMDGWLHLAVAQGKSLLLCNVYRAVDFTTAEYFIFLALSKLQLNPEQSVICFRTPLSQEQELSLYRYFKAVESI